MAEAQKQNNGTDKKGYGKRPWWFWVLVYVVFAVVVYGIIYLLFIHHSNGTGGYSY